MVAYDRIDLRIELDVSGQSRPEIALAHFALALFAQNFCDLDAQQKLTMAGSLCIKSVRTTRKRSLAMILYHCHDVRALL